MDKKTSTGSFDIILDMERSARRDKLCVAFGAGLFRKLGWGAGDWLTFDTSQTGKIAFQQIAESSETVFNARKLKLHAGFYKLCFYTALYHVPRPVYLSKDTATFNVDTWTLTITIPEEYHVPQDILNRPRPLTVDDIAAAFSKL